MSESLQDSSAELAHKIARLVEERGWNQEDFARITKLNRQTVRQILLQTSDRRLRNATVGACAEALGLSVNDLRSAAAGTAPAADASQRPTNGDDRLRHMLQTAKQPELIAWIERNPERARQPSCDEFDELLQMQGAGGPLATMGVEHFVGLIERKRKLVDKVLAIAGTEYVDLLEQMVDLIHEKVHPYGGR